MVWWVKKYTSLSHINITPCSIFVVIEPLKYTITIMFILLPRVFSHFFIIFLTLALKETKQDTKGKGGIARSKKERKKSTFGVHEEGRGGGMYKWGFWPLEFSTVGVVYVLDSAPLQVELWDNFFLSKSAPTSKMVDFLTIFFFSNHIPTSSVVYCL